MLEMPRVRFDVGRRLMLIFSATGVVVVVDACLEVLGCKIEQRAGERATS